MTVKTVQYQTQGTCCALIKVVLNNNIIIDVEFLGGCPGNLAGIRQLIKGMNIDDVIEKLRGIKCGSKSTSCPDQLCDCLLQYKQELSKEVAK